jgi:hypothetical protein
MPIQCTLRLEQPLHRSLERIGAHGVSPFAGSGSSSNGAGSHPAAMLRFRKITIPEPDAQGLAFSFVAAPVADGGRHALGIARSTKDSHGFFVAWQRRDLI